VFVTFAALVTGGANGIGRAIAEGLLMDGWKVALLDIAEPETPLEGPAFFIRGDVACETDVLRAVEQCIEEFGQLNGLVNNAGIGITRPLEELALDDWNRIIATNLTGTFLCTRHAAAHLRKSRGAVVNIASTRARQSEANTEAYSASKGGIVSLTHAMAISLGPDIRVNCISPGWIETNPAAVHSDADRLQHPCGRVGVPGDIATLAAYLLSDQAGFITGQDFAVDGGMTKKMIYTD
jgi:NAD(P)-dependent dehydrogenase (short-subunit alcohol dehydrogenase family)